MLKKKWGETLQCPSLNKVYHSDQFLKSELVAFRGAHLGPVSCDPVRWTLLLGAGLLACWASGGAESFR